MVEAKTLEERFQEIAKTTKSLVCMKCTKCKLPRLVLKNSIEHLRAKRDKKWFCPDCRATKEEAELTDKELTELEKFLEE